jgi:hypothetical protein
MFLSFALFGSNSPRPFLSHSVFLLFVLQVRLAWLLLAEETGVEPIKTTANNVVFFPLLLFHA